MSIKLYRGLYAITDSELLAPHTLVDAVEAAFRGGARVIQYRDKGDDHALRLEQARALLTICRRYLVPLIINVDIELAATIAADGVHVGAEDAPLANARERLGDGAIIGASCYNDLARAEQAVRNGADYVAFGRFFPSQTKPNAVQADLSLLRQASARLRVPIAAIGGITIDNAPQLIAAGADLLAVIHGVFGQADICAAAQRFATLFDSASVRNTLSA